MSPCRIALVAARALVRAKNALSDGDAAAYAKAMANALAVQHLQHLHSPSEAAGCSSNVARLVPLKETH